MAEKKVQMALCQTSVLKVYHAVIEDVIANVRDAFLDEGVDEQVLQEMKQIWRNKLLASKAVEINPEPPEPQPPQIIINSQKSSKAAAAKAKKAAAAAAAAASQLSNSTAGSATNSTTTGDVKPNLGTLQGAVSSSSAGAASSSAAGNGLHTANSTLNGTAIKQELHSKNPPPLMPTSSAMSAQQQKLTGAATGGQQQSASSGGSVGTAGGGGGGGGAGGGATPSNIPIVASLDPSRIMPVNITLPAPPGSINTESRVLTIHVPASALQENQLTQILTAQLISSIMTLPPTLASSVLQQHVNANLQSAKNLSASKQMDGTVDTSDEDESEESDDNIDNDDDDDLDKDDDDDPENEGGAEEEPLNSEDDVTDEDPSESFETDNVIVCQYDKITRSRNKWKFYLKDGIMNIGGKDYVFQKSNGDAEW